MLSAQKKLLLLLALAEAFIACITLLKYFSDIGDGGHFGGDFAVFWHAGTAALQGHAAALYDTATLVPDASGFVAPFIYPPHMLLLLWPLGGMGYNLAVALWTLVPLPLYFAVLYGLLKRSVLADETPRVRKVSYLTAFAMTLPLLLANALSGQSGAVVGALFMAVLLFKDRNPWLAGIALGMMSVKPQLGLLLFVALLAARQWRVLAAAAVTFGMLAGITTVWFGFSIWADYLHMTGAFAGFMTHGFTQFAQLAVGPYISLRGVGVPSVVAMVAQALVSVAVLGVTLRAFGRVGNRDAKLGLVACGSLLVGPYSLCYDLPLLAVAMIPLLKEPISGQRYDGLNILLFILILIFPYSQPEMIPLHVPLGLITLIGLFAALAHKNK